MADKEYVQVRATAMWAFTNKPSGMSGKYEITLAHLKKEEALKLQAIGVKVKKDDTNDPSDPKYKGVFVVAKTNFEPELGDADGKVLSSRPIIGNGSLVNVTVSSYPWSFPKSEDLRPGQKAKTGIGLNLDAIQILDLVEVEGGKKTFFKKSEDEVDFADDIFVVED